MEKKRGEIARRRKIKIGEIVRKSRIWQVKQIRSGSGIFKHRW